MKACFKPVSHESYGSRTPLYDDKYLGFVRLSYCVVCNNTRLPRASMTKTKFSTCSFSLRFLRNLMRTQDCHKTHSAAARHPRYLNHTAILRASSHIFRLQMPQNCRTLYCTAVPRMLRIVQLPISLHD